jgi:hypothetical protein
MAALEVLALNTTVPRIEAPQAGDTYTMPRAIAIAPEGLTGSAATTSFDVTQTWNTTGTPTAIKLNVTDTASNAASLLMDLRTAAGGSRFSVVKDGALQVTGPSLTNTGQIRSPSYEFTGIRWDGGGYTLTLLSGGVPVKIDSNQQMVLDDPRWSFGWSGTTYTGSPDLTLFRDAADTLAQRRGTNAQTFRIYNTFTDASNYERGKIQWDSNVLKIGTEKAGTGTARDLAFQTDGTTRMTLDASGRLLIGSTSSFNSAAKLQVQDNISLDTNGTGGRFALFSYGVARGFFDCPVASGQLNIGATSILTLMTSATERVYIDSLGNVGLGTATFGTSAAKVFSIGNGTEPSTGVANTVQFFSVDRSAGNTIPAIYCEGTGVTDAAITNVTVTNKIAIKVNGTIYYLLATTSAA